MISGKGQPVSALHHVHRLNDDVADPDVQMESSKDSGIHSRFHRKPCATIWRGVQVHDRRRDRELEPIIERRSGGPLKHFVNDIVRLPAGGVQARGV